MEKKHNEADFFQEMIQLYKTRESKNYFELFLLDGSLHGFHDLLTNAKQDKKTMLKKLKGVIKEWEDHKIGIRRKKILERRKKGVKFRPKFYDILHIAPFEPYKFQLRDLLKKRIKKQIKVIIFFEIYFIFFLHFFNLFREIKKNID